MVPTELCAPNKGIPFPCCAEGSLQNTFSKEKLKAALIQHSYPFSFVKAPIPMYRSYSFPIVRLSSLFDEIIRCEGGFPLLPFWKDKGETAICKFVLCFFEDLCRASWVTSQIIDLQLFNFKAVFKGLFLLRCP